jgi:hypothetical protein
MPDLIVFLHKPDDAIGPNHLNSVNTFLQIDSAIDGVLAHGINLYALAPKLCYIRAGWSNYASSGE